MTDLTTERPVRVRIAPSPTGDPHVGTAYIALFNLAFARRHGGQFILRIEDTDRERSRPEYEQAILAALRWLGLEWDEGPDRGGPCAPYRQSERLVYYKTAALDLLDRGHAYLCFQRPHELERIRAELMAQGGTQGLRSPDRELSREVAVARAAAGEPHVVRLRVPDAGEISYHDPLRREPTTWQFAAIDDQVLIKSDGYPTYHLANVVDDHMMEISHVIRGEEWLPSLPKHLLLYSAFGVEPPRVIHMPLIRNLDGSKLSKRRNPTSIDFYRAQGYLPEALLNFLGTLGYSPTGGSGDEKLSLRQFIEGFELDRVQTTGPKWELTKLDALNARYIREDHSPEQLYGRLVCWLLGDGYLSRTVAMLQPRLDTLADFIPRVAFLLGREPSIAGEQLIPPGLDTAATGELIQILLGELEVRHAWSAGAARQVANEVARIMGLPIRQITHILFVALTGGPVGPPVFEVIELLGKDRTRHRLRLAATALNGGKEPSKKQLDRWRSSWEARCAKPQRDEEVAS
jgi:glutamyl-tRNA synthetase